MRGTRKTPVRKTKTRIRPNNQDDEKLFIRHFCHCIPGIYRLHQRGAPDARHGPRDTPAEHKSGEILVKFSPYVSEILDKTAAATRSGGPATRSGIISVDEVLDIVGGYQIERVFPVDGRNEERTRESELHLWYVVRFGDDYSAEEVAKKLSALGEVQHVNLNRTIRRAYNAGKKAMPLTREALAAMQRATRCRRGYGLSLQRRAAADAVAPDQPRQPVRRQVDRRCRRAVRRGVEILDGATSRSSSPCSTKASWSNTPT